MRICISGSKGFVGKHLLAFLQLQQNVQLVFLDEVSKHLSNYELLEKSVGSFDIFIHLAATSFVPDSYTNPQHFYNNNIITTVNALELCRKYNAKFIFMSSYVYGHPQYFPIDEFHPISSPNVYAHTKILGESICAEYAKIFNISTIAIRPFNIYGQGQSSKFLIPSIISQAITGKITLMDAKPKRDYVHIADVVNAIYLATTAIVSEKFEVINIASGKSFSVADIINIVKKTYPNIEVTYKNIERPNEILDTIANISKAKQLLNWQPIITFEQGLTQIMEL